MSGISTGIGLISGIDTATLIDQLIALDSRPVQLLEQRVTGIDAKRTALLALSAQLLSVRNAVSNFDKLSFFRRFSSNSSNDAVITATAGETAAPGTYTFSVRSLVSNHSVLSRGFADANSTPIGAGTLTIEVGNGRVDASTDLDQLHGGRGVRRGIVSVTDRAGNVAEIDLRSAVTVSDVLRAINTAAGINVRASVTGIESGGAAGDRIVIEDLNGETATGTLAVADVNGGHLAEDLGLLGASSDPARIDGIDLVRLTDDTPLALLNDGNGVGRLFDGTDLQFASSSGSFDFDVSLSGILASRLDTRLERFNNGNGVSLGQFQITDRAGNEAVVDLADPNRPQVATIADVIQRINDDAAAAGVQISATVVNSNLHINDSTGLEGEAIPPLTIVDLPGADGQPGSSAADLGIAGEFEGQLAAGHELFRVQTVGDLLRAINLAPENLGYVQANISEDGNSIDVQATGAEGYTIRAGDASTTALDLGLADAVIDPFGSVGSDTLLSGLDTVLLDTLNGGSGVNAGEINITDRAGNSSGTIDLSAARTLKDVIDLINQGAPVDPAGQSTIVAEINAAGTGVVVKDRSGGTQLLRIEDVTGTLAGDLNIATDGIAEDQINGGNLQRQYISRQTLLDDLNDGAGVGAGEFRIADSTGAVHAVQISQTATTLGDVIDTINRVAPGTIEARINEKGDGLLIVDLAGGTEQLSITDEEGDSTASALRIAGTASTGRTSIDGSLETVIQISASDTLADVVEKINEENRGFTAGVVNDGGALNPFSLSLASNVSGRRGQLVLDTAGIELGFDTLTTATDAVVAIGGDDADNPILVTGDSNSLEGVIEGVTLDLLSVGEGPVTVDVAQDVDGIVESIQAFVDAYNAAQSTMSDLTSVDPETAERGILQGDRTVDVIRGRLHRAVSSPVSGVDREFSRLFSVGITVGANNTIEFDENRFREAYDQNPAKVETLFTKEEGGFGEVINEALDELTRDFDGLISEREALLGDQQQLLNNRIDDLNILLDSKRARLELQFIAMERALADLQGQQAALSQLAALAG